VSEIAQKAGVARVTLYRHFPDDLALFTACTSHYLTLNPTPDLDRWAAIDDPAVRLRTGLGEAYAYHRRTEAMMTAAEHEVRKNPILADLMKPLDAYWATARDVLAGGWPVTEEAEPSFRAALGLALSLSTWRTLTSHHGLSDPQCVSLLVEMIRLGFDPARRWDGPDEAAGQ